MTARKVATVGSAAMASRLLGFGRDVGIAAVLGAGPLSDAFFAALQVPNLFRRLLAEGALNAAFVPIWLRLRRERGLPAARRFGGEAIGAFVAVLGAATLLGLAASPALVRLLAPGFESGGERFDLAITFLRLCLPYVAVAGVVSVLAAVLNAEGRVAAAAFGLIVFNAVMLAAVGVAVFANEQADAGMILSFGVVLAGLAQMVLVGAAAFRPETAPLPIRIAFDDTLRRFFVRMGPGVIAGGIPQLKLMAGVMVVSASPAAVSWLYYANRLYELPLGIASVAISSVLIPVIAASIQSREEKALAAAQSRGLEAALGLSLPAALAFAVLADLIAGVLFERGAFGPEDTRAVAAALIAICAGLPGHVLEKVFGAVSFAHDDTRTPMLAALAGLATAVAGAILLFPHYGHVGVASAIAVSGWVGALLLGFLLKRRRWLVLDAQAARRLPLIALATAVMGAAIVAARAGLEGLVSASAVGRAVELVALVALGLIAYFAALWICRVFSPREFAQALRREL